MYHQTYPSYFPYQRPYPGVVGAIDHFKKYGVQKYGVQKYGVQKPTFGQGYPPTHLSLPASLRAAKREDDRDASPPTDMKYLSTNCALLTYFDGDSSAAVDEHFSRALSRLPSAAPYAASPDKPHRGSAPCKDVSPMAHRNFPASFWNSNYRPPLPYLPPHDLPVFPPSSAPTDHYMPPPALHPTPDPWRYGFSPQYHPDLAYPTFPAYPSLLPGTRLDSKPTPADGWPQRYHNATSTLASMQAAARHESHLHPNALPGSLEASLQESGKDLYWF